MKILEYIENTISQHRQASLTERLGLPEYEAHSVKEPGAPAGPLAGVKIIGLPSVMMGP